MIVAAAIKFAGREGHELICFVPRPGRHHDVLHSMWHQFADGKSDRTHESYAKEVQGFLTDDGRFLNRREAFIHVKECGQRMIRSTDPKHYQGDELYSEDLW
jgi:hypothetical protein